MLELDVVLGRLLEHAFPYFTDAQKIDFEKMLSIDDPTLYAWLMGLEVPSDKNIKSIVEQCIQYNEKM
jgi:antitoxin CptB